MAIVLVLGVVIGISFAWWSSYATQQSINKITSDCLKIEIEDINNSAINLEKAYPITDAEVEELVPYTFKVTNTCNNSADYEVHLEVMDLGNNQMASQYLALDFNSEGKKLLSNYKSVEPTYKESDYTANEARYLTGGVLNPKESITYHLKIWMDESVTVNDPVMNKEWIGKVSVTSSMVQFATTNFSEYIMTKNYTYIEKIEHEATEQTPALTDYRYVGANPDNYVYFGCEKESCTEDNLYRIIGVIPTQSSESGAYVNRVKLIKATNWEGKTATSGEYTVSKKGYLWDSATTNKWETSSLQKTLNDEYLRSLGKDQWLIGTSKWYLGALDNNNYKTYTSDQAYLGERSNVQGLSKGAINYVDNVGLMYPSDLGYSLGLRYKTESIYDNAKNYNNGSWLYNSSSKGDYEWTITPESSYTTGPCAWFIYGGHLDFFMINASHALGVRPAFFLKEDVMVTGGAGSKEDPYQLGEPIITNFGDYIMAQSYDSDSGVKSIQHEAASQTPVLTDYRYVGANPNNYVCFGYEGEEKRCPDDNLYQIIGVIPTQSSASGAYENRVKLIKATNWEGRTATLAETISYTNTKSGRGYNWDTNEVNKWETSSLQKTLNDEYYKSLGECGNYIAPSKWYLGAANYNNVSSYTANSYYATERGTVRGKSQGSLSYVNKIGLMYPSDFGYSIDGGENQEKWSVSAVNSNWNDYRTNSWLYLGIIGYEWTITPESSYSVGPCVMKIVHGSGGISHFLLQNYIGVRPTFYLKTSIQYTSGDGSIDNPYRIGL